MTYEPDFEGRVAADGTVRRVLKRALPAASGPGRVLRGMDRLERAAVLDGCAGRLADAVRALPLGRGRDVLHGRWLGHPVHPVMVQVPIGAWFSAAVLDAVPGQRRAAGTLIGVGLAAAVPAAVAGWVDWAELERRQMRVGLVHAAANATGVALYAGSLAARVRGRAFLGKALGFAGLTVVGVGGAIGGHMAYRQGSGVNHAASAPELVAPGWHGIGTVEDLPLGRAVRRHVGDVAVLAVREDEDRVRVLLDACGHDAGSLSEGVVEDGRVRCPLHGCVFRLEDGWNVRGPATAPQPAFDTRVAGGRVEVRLRAPEAQDTGSPSHDET
ncbi:Rieske 2Fe-2S domain-containing protein [Streptomyces sp. NPDC090093]|uniref:Rieske 2Fe-2S domain-containing protein n=1 Tax=Streptomyces sp. NPDC090093 TaxID=3365945 RepID=UPI0037FFDDA4